MGQPKNTRPSLTRSGGKGIKNKPFSYGTVHWHRSFLLYVNAHVSLDQSRILTRHYVAVGKVSRLVDLHTCIIDE